MTGAPLCCALYIHIVRDCKFYGAGTIKIEKTGEKVGGETEAGSDLTMVTH